MIETYLQQINDAVDSKDYSLVTRRCLDYCKDYTVEKSIETKIFELRKTYLNASVSQSLNENEFTNQAKEIITELKNVKEQTTNNTVLEKCVFSANNISKQFTAGKAPFKLYPLSFDLNLGEITGVVGENGNGKTTLLRIVAGLLSNDEGTIKYPILTVNQNNHYSAKNKFAFIPQRIAKWHGTLMENLMFFASIHSITGEENSRQIDFILYRLGLDKFRDLTWNEISSGYRMRFELAKALLWRPHLLVLDEPLANLDINAQQLFLQDLKFFTQSVSYPISIILSSQQLHEIERIADNTIFIRQGKTIYNGKQASFGIDRLVNNFEIAGTFNLQQLQQTTSKLNNCKVEDAGTAFIISCDKNIAWFTILETLHKNNLKVNYFRDISQSTRQLFHKDI
jgi:ABC-2 type transport system ATP-binding protein